MTETEQNMLSHDEWAHAISRYIRQGLSFWRDNNVAAFAGLLHDDVEFMSPYVVSGAMRGKSALIAYSIKHRQETGQRTLADIMLGVGTFTLLLRDSAGFVTWRLATNGAGLVRQVATSFSVGADFGASLRPFDAQTPEIDPDWRDSASQRIVRGLAALRHGDFDAVADLLSEDIQIRSPFIDEGVVTGKERAIAHMLARQQELRNVRLVDILLGAGKIDLLLDGGTGPQIWELETDGTSPVDRILVSYSVGREFGDERPEVD